MNLLDLFILTLASTETSTATWAVLMVVVSAMIGLAIASYRQGSSKLSASQKEAEDAKKEANLARHAQVIDKIDAVHNSVGSVDRHVEKIESALKEHQISTEKHFAIMDRRVGKLEVDRAKIMATIGMANGEDTE